MPPPMIPAPRTAADSTFEAVLAIFFATFPTNWSPRKMSRDWSGGSLRHAREGLSLDLQRVFTAAAGALLHRRDGGDGEG